jgi:uncharacterized protein (TIGR02246 family)
MNRLLSVCELLVIALLVMIGSGCGVQEARNDARAAIEEGNSKFAELYARGDAAAIAALYTEDAIVFPPGSDMVKGRQAITEFWGATKESGVTSVTLSTVDVGESGDLAYEVGTAVLTIEQDGQGPVEAAAKYVVVWKRQSDGSWQLHRDIWNDLPSR